LPLSPSILRVMAMNTLMSVQLTYLNINGLNKAKLNFIEQSIAQKDALVTSSLAFSQDHIEPEIIKPPICQTQFQAHQKKIGITYICLIHEREYVD